MTVLLALAALAVAIYAVKLVKNLPEAVPSKPYSSYTKKEIDDQFRGTAEGIDHLRGRVYELNARVFKLEE